MISNRCARKSLVTNCNSIISKNYLRFLVDSNVQNPNFTTNNVKITASQRKRCGLQAGMPLSFLYLQRRYCAAGAVVVVVFWVGVAAGAGA